MSTQDQELIRYALIGYEQQKRQIEQRIAELRTQVGASSTDSEPETAETPKRQISDEARKRMAAAQQARWAGHRAAAAPAKKKSTMSAEGRARIAEAQRKRWAAAKKTNGRAKK